MRASMVAHRRQGTRSFARRKGRPRLLEEFALSMQCVMEVGGRRFRLGSNRLGASLRTTRRCRRLLDALLGGFGHGLRLDACVLEELGRCGRRWLDACWRTTRLSDRLQRVLLGGA